MRAYVALKLIHFWSDSEVVKKHRTHMFFWWVAQKYETKISQSIGFALLAELFQV